MGDEQYIQALQQSVKQEIIQNYFRERRIIEEEVLLVTEAASAYHGGLYAWDKAKAILGKALLTPGGRARFFELAGLAPPSPWSLDRAAPAVGLRPLRGLTRGKRYLNLIGGLYQGLWDQAQELEAERQKALQLLEEVNGDIRAFEAGHDLMMLAAYLRSLDPAELQRRKILGVNFTPTETTLSAEALCFKTLGVAQMGLDQQVATLRPPDEVLAAAQGLLKGLAQGHPRELDQFL